MTLLEVLKQHALSLTPDFSGQFQRNGSQWLKGQTLTVEGKTLRVAFFGDFARGLSKTWNDAGAELSPEETAQIEAEMSRVREENRAEQERRWAQVLPEVAAEWDSFCTVGTTPYMDRKKMKKLHGCRVEPHALGARLIVPARDTEGRLWGYQRIYSEKLALGTDKIFREGARKEGCFHVLGVLRDSAETIYIAEGISTAYVVHQALEEARAVVSCFDAGNLYPVAVALRAKYPSAELVFCADNDQYPAKDGNVYHTGRVKAEKAAKAVGRARVVLPEFKDTSSRPTDFDDLARLEGLQAVKDTVLGAVPAGTGTTQPQNTPALSEMRLVQGLLGQFAPNLIRQGRDFFRYTGTHWEHMEPLSAPDYFKRLIDAAAGGRLKFKDIQSAYNRFYIHVPQVPAGVSLFAPNPLKQNFRNGTLELLPESDGSFKLGFHAHRREDYLIHCHEFDYREDAERNEEFEQSLDRIWAGDPDIEAKKAAYFEVLGACLVNAFRKIVVFVGPPNTGKSTLILFAANMVHESYRCSVDPTEFHGFNLETMAGKLLNYDTDINLVKPISDSVLKKVEDRSPMRIRRKGISDIYAPIPGMQLFGANRMPISSEAGQAYNRRMLAFQCDKFQPKGEVIQDFAQHVWRMNAQGVVARAIEGLKRLCQNRGYFTVPDSSRQQVQEWQQEQGDLVQDFVSDMDNGEVVDGNSTVMRGPEYKIERDRLWNLFKTWAEKTAPRQIVPGRNKFYARLKHCGFSTKTVDGARYFAGIGLIGSAESSV